jgi:hypothetical protein
VARQIFDPENGGDAFFRTVGSYTDGDIFHNTATFITTAVRTSNPTSRQYSEYIFIRVPYLLVIEKCFSILIEVRNILSGTEYFRNPEDILNKNE